MCFLRVAEDWSCQRRGSAVGSEQEAGPVPALLCHGVEGAERLRALPCPSPPNASAPLEPASPLRAALPCQLGPGLFYKHGDAVSLLCSGSASLAPSPRLVVSQAPALVGAGREFLHK